MTMLHEDPRHEGPDPEGADLEGAERRVHARGLTLPGTGVVCCALPMTYLHGSSITALAEQVTYVGVWECGVCGGTLRVTYQSPWVESSG